MSSLSSAELPVAQILEVAARIERERGGPATVPMVPEPIDAIRVVVEPSDEPTVVYFRRYPDLATARLAAGDDPDAMARESADGFGLMVRSDAGVIPAASRAGAG